jgi:hypothetical protein
MAEPAVPDEGLPFTPEENAIIAEVTEALGAELMAKVDDMLLYQFIRGYAYEAANDAWASKVIEMLGKAMEWREKEDVDNIVSRELERRDEFNEIWQTVVSGTDEAGRLVVVERLGKIDPPKLLDLGDENVILLHHIRTVEEVRLLKYRIRREKGHHLYKIVSVLDLDGFGWAHMGKSFYDPIKKAIEIDGWFYPESLYKMFIVNSPWVFKTLWAVVRPWLHPITQAKINVVGSDYKKKLAEIGVTDEDLPDFLGGSGANMLDTIDLKTDSYSTGEADEADGDDEEGADEDGEPKKAKKKKSKKKK